MKPNQPAAHPLDELVPELVVIVAVFHQRRRPGYWRRRLRR
jgi:hypothetical protein